jgi:hypothetical protein
MSTKTETTGAGGKETADKGAYRPFTDAAREQPESKLVTLTEKMQTTVLACYLKRPTAFAAHVTELPKLFSGIRSTVAATFNLLLTSTSAVSVTAAFQEAFTKAKKIEMRKELEALQREVEQTDVRKELPYVLDNFEKWLFQRIEDLAVESFLAHRSGVEADQSKKALAGFEQAKQNLLTVLLKEPIGLRIESALDLLNDDIPEPDQVIEGVLDKSTLALFGSSSKSFKTWVTLHVAVAVACGWPWFGLKCRKGRVLYLNFELSRKRLQQRLRAISEKMGVEIGDGIHIVHLKGINVRPESLMRWLILQGKLRDYALVIIDPLYSMLQGKVENANEEMVELMTMFITLATNAGAAVWICHHFSKGNQSSKAAIDRFSGAGAFGRAPDTVITMTPLKPDKCYVVELALRNHIDVEKFGIRWSFPLMVVDASLDVNDLREPKRGGAKKKFKAEQLLDCFEDGMTSTQHWEAVHKSTHMSRSTFDRLRQLLVVEDVLQERDHKWFHIGRDSTGDASS